MLIFYISTYHATGDAVNECPVCHRGTGMMVPVTNMFYVQCVYIEFGEV